MRHIWKNLSEPTVLEPKKSLTGHPLHEIDLYLDTYRVIHEQLLGSRWLSQLGAAAHPATSRLALIPRTGRINFDGATEQDKLPVVGRILLDSYVWRELRPPPVDEADSGPLPLSQVLPPKKLQVLRSRARVPDQYEDALVELSTAAWYASHGWNVEVEESEGQPDLRLEHPDSSERWAVECKHLRSTSPHRLSKIIQKANTQLRQTANYETGVVHIHVGTLPIRRVTGRLDMPKIIPPLGERAAHSLRGDKNRAVDAVLFTWDDWLMVMNRGDRSLANIVFRRRPYVAHPPMLSGELPPEIMNRIYSGFEMEFQVASKGA